MKRKTRDSKVSVFLEKKNDFNKGTKQTRFSIEIFPPRSPDVHDNLIALVETFHEIGVTHVNITGKPYRNRATLDFVRKLRVRIRDCICVPHIIACGCDDKELDELMESYAELGIHNVFAVAGDTPMEGEVIRPRFPFACDLVAAIKKRNDSMCVGVAGYPAGHHAQKNFLSDVKHLKHKVDSGADYIVTQLFFSNETFFDFEERCKLFGIKVPIVPGITGVRSEKHLRRMTELVCGSVVPAGLLKSLFHARNEKEAWNAGSYWLERQVNNLVEHSVPLVHFFVFNTENPFRTIIRQHSRT